LHIVNPHLAVFGKKDYQQLAIIRRMVRDLDMDVEIEGGALMREEDGIAMSSRNVRLTADDRQKALAISRSLKSVAEEVGQSSKGSEVEANTMRQKVISAITSSGGEVDYVVIVHPDSLENVTGSIEFPVIMAVAARYGSVRLLDNMELVPQKFKKN